MTSPVFSIVFPVLLAVAMFGLGLTLTVADFARVARVPRAVLVTLACQIVLLPALCLALVVAVGLGPDLALGMMVLAAAPGGPLASLFSQLARGDVALNITVTAVNSVTALVTLPVVVALSADYLLGADAAVGLQGDKVVQVALLVLVPVAVGMAVRGRAGAVADRVLRPLRIATILAVFLAILAAILPQAAEFLWGLAAVGLVCLLFSVLSLTVGYLVPRLARVGHRQAVAASLEIGIHNAVLAVTVAATVLENEAAAVAPAVYGALMYLPATAFVWLVTRRAPGSPPAAPRRRPPSPAPR